jgi:hypothetical protein
MIFRINDFAVCSITGRPPPEGPKTMNKFRCLFLGAIVVISSSMLALGGEMQAPGKSNPTPTPTPTASALTTASTSDGLTQPTSTEEIVWPDATTILVEILLTIF